MFRLDVMRFFQVRSKDYIPLPSTSAPQSPTRKNSPKLFSRRQLFVAALLIGSLVANLVLVYHLAWKSSREPLDNYQALNPYPFLDEEALSPNPLSPEHAQDHAVVTTLYTNEFATAVATLGHSLRKANTTARLILLYFPDKVSPSALCLATSSGFTPHPISRIAPPHDGEGIYFHFVDQYSKLQLWTLDQLGIKSLVYLDADTLVRKNFDELFSLPFTFAAVPDVFLGKKGFTLNFNAGVLYLRPSTEVFNSMVSQLSSAKFPLVDAEQSYLNYYFGAEAVRLPLAYNANLAIKRRSVDLWEGTKKEQRIVHFTLVKPFLGPKYAPVAFGDLETHVLEVAEVEDGLFKEEMLWWREMFIDFKRTYGLQLLQCPEHRRS